MLKVEEPWCRTLTVSLMVLEFWFYFNSNVVPVLNYVF